MNASHCKLFLEGSQHDSRVEVYCDRYAASDYGELFFASVAGAQMAVRAVTAALASRRSVTVSGSTAHTHIMPGWTAAMRFRTAKLPSGLSHSIVWREGDLSGIFVPDLAPKTVYKTVYDAFPVPLLPEWAEWLTKSLRRFGWLTPLEGFGMKPGLIKTNAEKLDKLIADGVEQRQIRIPIERKRSA